MSLIAILNEQKLFESALANLIQTFDNCKVEIRVPTIRHLPTNSHHPEINVVLCSDHIFHKNYENDYNLLCSIFPNARIILISDHIDRNRFRKLADIGVRGFFSKNSDPEEFKSAILSLNYNELLIGSEMHEIFVKNGNNHEPSPSFTPRELEVLQLVCLEKTNIEISKILGLSVRTVETFRRKIILKSDCKNIIGVILKTLHLEPALILNSRRA